jgi:hypothetical protein
MIDFKISDNPSALVLKNGTWMQLDTGAPKPQTQSGLVHVADIPNVENCGKAHFVLSNPSQITEFFEAIPGKENRLWKGKDDLSAEIRLKNRGDALMVRISVRDDRHIPVKIGSLNTGDFIQAVVRSSVGGKSQSINFSAPKSCSEGVSDYEACVSWSSLGAKNGKVPEYIIFEILIEDDDGLGRECAMGIEKKVD